MKRTLSSAALVVAVTLAIAGAGAGPGGSQPQPVRFRSAAPASGIDFVLENGATPEKHIIETMPGGVAAFDYDGDSLVDLFFANGAASPSLDKSDPKYRNRLYKDLGGMKFRDVTKAARLAGDGYSIGAAAGDYDNDGHPDLFVAGVRGNHLYRNNGDGTFSDQTEKAGVRGGVWAIAGGWFDYDNDGRLDLLVVNYLKWDAATEPACGDPPRVRAYCHPKMFEGLANALYRNRGDGTFEDVSAASGIAAHIGKGMSLAFGDYDGNGYPDVFITNDKIPNFLFRNLGNGTFEEAGDEAGVSLASHGRPVSAMGADFRDYDNDGLPDITFAALAGETFPLFRNQGRGWFRDVTYTSRAGPLSIGRSGWSPAFCDLNNDGWKDVFVSGAHVNDTVEAFEASRYEQPNFVFLNAGDGTFRDGAAGAGADFAAPRAHRGAVIADFDNDGKLDAAVSAIGVGAEIWENVSPGANTWLAVRLAGRRSNRDGIGAHVRVGSQWNDMTSSAGYASSSLAPVHFGTGGAQIVDVEVWWPSGKRQVMRGVKTNQTIRAEEPR